MKNKYLCILDIGNTKLVVLLARVYRDKIVNIYDYILYKDDLVKKGTIQDSEEFLRQLDQALEKIEKKSGTFIEEVYINIPPNYLAFRKTEAHIILNEGLTKVISSEDLKRIKRQAELLGIEPEEEIVQSTPLSYSVDNQRGILNPLGLYARKLGIELSLLCVKSNYLINLNRLLNRVGRNLKQGYSSTNSSYYAVNFDNFSTNVEVLCDIGGEFTEVAIFKRGILTDFKMLEWGGNNLTIKLMYNLGLNRQEAENLKISNAKIIIEEEKEKEILVKKKNIFVSLDKNVVNRIVTEEVKNFFQELKKKITENIELNQIQGICVLGRTALMEGFLELLEIELGIPVKLAYPNSQINSLFPNVSSWLQNNRLEYLSSLGMLLYLVKPLWQHDSGRGLLKRTLYKFKEIYQEYF